MIKVLIILLLHVIEKLSAVVKASFSNPAYSLVNFPTSVCPSVRNIFSNNKMIFIVTFIFNLNKLIVITRKLLSQRQKAPSQMKHGPITLSIDFLFSSNISKFALHKLNLYIFNSFIYD